MASKNKTPLGLSQWEGTDTPERLDFNSDNLLTDWALMERVKKVENAKAGNFAVLTEDGGIVDSGKSAGDYERELGKKVNGKNTIYSSLAEIGLSESNELTWANIVSAMSTNSTLVTSVAYNTLPLIVPINSGGTLWFVSKVNNRRTAFFVPGNDSLVYTGRYYNNAFSGWVKLATTTPPQELDLPLRQGFVGTNCRFQKNDSGIVVVHYSIIRSGTSDDIGDIDFADLPEGYRPLGEVISAAGATTLTSRAAGFVKVYPWGTISAGFGNSTVSNAMGTIVFYVAP